MPHRPLIRMLRRSPFLFWGAALALAAGTGLFVSGVVSRAEAEAARYGSLTTVALLVRPVEAGRVVDPADVEIRRLPKALLPSGEVASEPAGHTALVPLLPGEVVMKARLAPWGLSGTAALLPAGTRALAVPAGPGGRPPLQILDRVDVLATIEPVPGAGPPAFAVASGALVVGVDDEDTVTVAVTSEEAPGVAFAITHGSVTLALRSA